MSDIKLPQGSDYHGDGKLFFKEDSYREKFPKGSNWKESDGNKHGVEIIGMDIRKYKQAITKIERLERELKYARECNEVKDKYWDKIKVERNSFLLEKERLEKICESLRHKNTTTNKCVVPGTNIPYENSIQGWIVSLREKRKKRKLKNG